MTTLKKRINVSLDKEMAQSISLLAERKNQPKSAVIADLARKALHLQEDLTWAKLAESRKKSHKGRYLTHEEAWGI